MDLLIGFAILPTLALLATALVLVLRRRDGGRAAASLDRLGLREAADATEALDRVTGLPRRHRTEANLGRLVGAELHLLRSVSTSELRPQRTWVADDLDRPGVIAAARAHLDTTTSSALSHRSSTGLGVQVVVARLPFAVDGRVALAPHYVGFDPDRLSGVLDVYDRVAPMPRPVDDDVFCRWYMAVDSTSDAELVRTDARLRALLWALRTKVAGAREHVGDAERAVFEAAHPNVPRTADLEQVIVDGDLLVLVGQAGPWTAGVAQRFLDIAQAVTTGR